MRAVDTVDTVEALEALYGAPSRAALAKVAPRLTPAYRRWIMASRFCILSTVGPEGADGSPRGDDGPVVREIDAATLAMPDWSGNQRIDSLRNIVRDGRVALLFLVPGSEIAVRVNGRGRLTDDADLCESFAQNGRRPRTVILVEIAEIYAQCPKAIMRSGLWSRDDAAGLPTLGEMLKDATEGAFDGDGFDRDYRPAERLW